MTEQHPDDRITVSVGAVRLSFAVASIASFIVGFALGRMT